MEKASGQVEAPRPRGERTTRLLGLFSLSMLLVLLMVLATGWSWATLSKRFSLMHLSLAGFTDNAASHIKRAGAGETSRTPELPHGEGEPSVIALMLDKASRQGNQLFMAWFAEL